MPSPTSLVAVAVSGWVCYSVCYAIWNAYFGSLSDIPGPKLAASTRFVLVLHKIRGDAEAWKVKLHRTYGDIVRTAPNEISIANGEAWKDIYGYASGSPLARCDKDPMFYGQQSEGTSLVIADDPDHVRMRKCFSNAFSDKAVREQESFIQNYISQLISNIGSVSSAKQNLNGNQAAGFSTKDHKIDLAKQYNFTTFDIMGDLAFGEPLGCLANSEYIPWISMIFGALRLMTVMGEINFYPRIRDFLAKLIPRSLHEKKEQHLKFSADRVDKRLSIETSRPDIWHYVLTKEKAGLSRQEMYANAALFMIAGTETSATTLGGLTYYLLTNPETMKTCVEEIRTTFTSSDQINGTSVSTLKYLNACINEAIRMHPPVPIGLPRVVPKGGLSTCGHNLPEGTSLYIHQLSTYRNPRNFIHPDKFLPQRWLSDTDTDTDTSTKHAPPSIDFTRDNKSCLQPFSVGPRNCIGQNLAILEIRLIITQVLYHFDLTLCPESRGWDEQRVFHLWESKPLMVTAKAVVR